MRGVAACLALLFVVVGCASDDDGSGQPSGRATVQTSLDDAYPSTTAKDWVTYADAVAVVTVVNERNSPSGIFEESGEGAVDRLITLQVDSVVWRRPGARELPPTLEYLALGWHVREGESLPTAAEVVAPDRPRLELDRTYVMALEWQPPLCYQGDGEIPGKWGGLGSGSALPFEDRVVGAGEFGGDDHDPDEILSSIPGQSLASQVVGQPLATLSTLLDRTQPGVRDPDYGPMPSTCAERRREGR